jgi:ABC-type cobalt transport system substrate-binding protein
MNGVKIQSFALAALLWIAALLISGVLAAGEWEGMDKSVVEKIATDAGRPPRAPYVDTDRGDLPLFMFLIAGACGGFIAGYSYRKLIHENKERSGS